MAEKRKVNLIVGDWERNFNEAQFKFRRLNDWDALVNVADGQPDVPEDAANWQGWHGWQDWNGWQGWHQDGQGWHHEEQGEINGRQDLQDGQNGQHDEQANMDDAEMGEVDDQL
jgi:hypothetical protein